MALAGTAAATTATHGRWVGWQGCWLGLSFSNPSSRKQSDSHDSPALPLLAMQWYNQVFLQAFWQYDTSTMFG